MLNLFKSYTDFIQELHGEVITYEGVERFEASIKPILRPQLLVYASWLCFEEVFNGGFVQLFHNSTGILTPEAIIGFRRVGMPMLADTFDQAAAILGPVFPRDRDQREAALFEASQLNETELQNIFRRCEIPYLALVEATKNLPLDELAAMAWELAETENGGFEASATAYVNNIPPSDF